MTLNGFDYYDGVARLGPRCVWEMTVMAEPHYGYRFAVCGMIQ